ncbi:MAG: glycosyltransferase family 2 protein [Patescibacteria group bacterium]|jgi:GT2 family glycosyltransferase
MKKRNIELSIIIVNYNVKEKISTCISLLPKNKYEIIVIDNNSVDGSYHHLIKIFSNKVRFVNNSCNIGFAKAVNQGIKLAKGKLILLLNPDTVPNKEAIEVLLDFLRKDSGKIGLVGGRLTKPGSDHIHDTFVNKPNFWTGVFEFTNLKKIFPNNKYSRNFYYKGDDITKPKLVYGLSGGFLMFRRDLIKDIGYFDENFFMYLEDVDFGVRSRQNGYQNYYLPQAKIVHDSGSSSRKSKYKINVKAWRHSRNYYFCKHCNYFERVILSALFYIDDLVVDIFHKIKKEPLS